MKPSSLSCASALACVALAACGSDVTGGPATPGPPSGASPAAGDVAAAPRPIPTDAAPPSTQRAENPFAGAVAYVNDEWSKNVLAEASATSDTATRAAITKVASQPTFVWLDRIAAIGGTTSAKGLRAHLDAALAQQATAKVQVVVEIVVYDLPNRDCNALASNGELAVAAGGMARYKVEYVDAMAAILADAKYATLRIVDVVEVDSLPNLLTNAAVPKCQEAAGPGGYVEGVRYALDKLGAIPNVYNYVDVGHSGWLGWDDNRSKTVAQMANVISGTSKGWASIAGFATNTANYTPLQETNLPDPNLNVGGQPLCSARFYEWNRAFDEQSYATTLRNELIAQGAPPSLGMLIDTGRNGWGGAARPSGAAGATVDDRVSAGRVDRRHHRGNWCNQSGAGIGELPKAAPLTGIHAYVWIKPPGESDGIATPTPGGPNAEGKQHDPMCDPAYVGSQKSNGGNKTGALAGAPHAGEWFPEHFRALVANAYPALGGAR